jgi:putative FmdB family regulatory protein
MILRTYACEACGHFMEVELRSDQWNTDPPDCPRCTAATQQQFTPVAIGGSLSTRARDTALDIAEKDYGVADINFRHGDSKPQVRYRDTTPQPPATWGANNNALSQAMAFGKQARLEHGDTLGMLRRGIREGTVPDIIQNSKRMSAKVW